MSGAAIAILLGASTISSAANDGPPAPIQSKLQWQPYRPSDRVSKAESAQVKNESTPDKCETKSCYDRPKRDASVRLAAADDSVAAPILADPFADGREVGATHRQALAVEEVETLPAPKSVMADHSGSIQQMPAELENTAPGTDMHEEQTMKAYQVPGLAPQTPPQSMPSDDLSSPQRTMQSPQEDCRIAYERVKKISVDKISLDIKVAGRVGTDVPFECTLTTDQFSPRCWHELTYTWKASALCHKPLYFEQEALERYGHSAGWVCEELLAGAHFFGDVALLPYHLGVEPPCECIYDLGVYRVGDCAPWICNGFPFSCRGMATAAVGYGAVVALFP